MLEPDLTKSLYTSVEFATTATVEDIGLSEISGKSEVRVWVSSSERTSQEHHRRHSLVKQDVLESVPGSKASTLRSHGFKVLPDTP